VFANERELHDAAPNFEELASFLSQDLRPFPRKFVEVSLGDSGLGIARRIRSSRPDLQTELSECRTDLECINTVIERALSSKRHHDGAGHGIELALQAASSIAAFVCMRSGNAWGHFFSRTPSERPRFAPVRNASGTDIAGTLVCMLAPAGAK
jgi:hypothetical protein